MRLLCQEQDLIKMSKVMKIILLTCFLSILFSTLAFASLLQGNDSIISFVLTTEESSDWSIIENKKPDDTIKVGGRNLLIYSIPCDANKENIKIILVENKERFKIFYLPYYNLCNDYENYISVCHQQVNGKGMPEIIVRWLATFTNFSGTMGSSYQGIYIIDIENDKCLIDIPTKVFEESNEGRNGGTNEAISYERIIKIKNKEIVISEVYRMDEYDLSPNKMKDVLSGEDAKKEFHDAFGSISFISAGRYKWTNSIFIKQKEK